MLSQHGSLRTRACARSFYILYKKIMMLLTLGAKLLLLTSFNLKPQSMSKIMRKFAYQN